MATAKIIYEGNLRTQAEHIQSGIKIITDAPVDNKGKGEAFSPTDLTATSLGACIITTIGIAVLERPIKILAMNAEVTKIMASAPRRISEIKVDVHIKLDQESDTEKNRALLKEIGINCPVAKSLNTEIKQTIEFDFE